jgi:predicted ATP-grasp superfamily ATP-dependent carboligase
MRLFIYEYLSAPGARSGLSDPLTAEGRAMLAAVLGDFGRVLGVKPFTLPSASPAVGQPGDAAFRDMAGAADYTLVIAPEFDDILLSRCRLVEEAGGRLLGSSPNAVRLTADKLALGRHLAGRGVPTPPCRPVSPPPHLPCPAVLKPRHGAGSLATFLVKRTQDLRACLLAAKKEGWESELLLQPFVPGQPASAAFLIGPRQCVPLLPAAQVLSADGRFHYRGGTLPLPPDLAARAERLARRAVEAVPGLGGYVGVDVVLGEAADGSEDWVIEINPRLTTSYVGLRALAEVNLAEAMLRVGTGQEIADLSWRTGTVRFQPDGRVAMTGPTA